MEPCVGEIVEMHGVPVDGIVGFVLHDVVPHSGVGNVVSVTELPLNISVTPFVEVPLHRKAVEQLVLLEGISHLYPCGDAVVVGKVIKTAKVETVYHSFVLCVTEVERVEDRTYAQLSFVLTAQPC